MGISEVKKETLAVIPVYCDNTNIRKVMDKFTKNFVDKICIVVDCPDKNDTNLLYENPAHIPVKIIINQSRKGIGSALRQGINYAIDNGFEYVVIMAGNNKDDPSEIPRVLQPIIEEKYDYVQGSRFLPGGKGVNNPLLRGVFSRLYPFIWTMFTSVRCTDVTNGFRAYRLSIFKDTKINIWQEWLDNYELEYYLHYKVLTLGYRVKEVPVTKTYSHRHKGGYSKISPLRDWWQIVGPLICLKLKVRN
jgi:dolichol-phosphate mannosyltransferase